MRAARGRDGVVRRLLSRALPVLLLAMLLAAFLPRSGSVSAPARAAAAEGPASTPAGHRSVVPAPVSKVSTHAWEWSDYRRVQQRWDAAVLAEPVPAGLAWRTVQVDGVQRRYLLSVPPSHGHPAPLVLAFHGLRQRAAWFATATGLLSATRAAGEVLAVPESRGPAFNDGRLATHGPHDSAFALALIQQLVGRRVVDAHRIVVTGFSNGAGMAMAVAAEHPDRVEAVVAVGGELINGLRAPRPTGPVRAYLVHGTADRIQPWQGRQATDPLWPAYISESDTAAQWVHIDHAGPESTRMLRGRPGQATVGIRSWAPGPDGAAVTLFALNGVGHRWPVGRAYLLDATALVVHAAASTVPAAIPSAAS